MQFQFLAKFLKIKLKYFVILVLAIICVLLYKANKQRDFQYSPLSQDTYPVILWWTPFTGEHDTIKSCAKNCLFSNNRSYIGNADLKALLFYGSHLAPDDMPPGRWIESINSSNVLWCLLHEESPRNTALLQHNAALSLFNLSATFSRHSNFPLTLQHLPGIDAITGSEFLVPLSIKTQLQQTLAPVVYVQSDCDTPSERDAYVSELMKYIPVDSYGACLHNKQLPEEFQDAAKNLNEKRFWHFLAQYKFSIAFENAVCDDYITEKLWRPLIVGSIPIYYGSPLVDDWLPNSKSLKSAIKITDFETPKALANYILTLNSNEELYRTYLQHKNGDVNNKNLLHALQERQWHTENNDDLNTNNFVEEFECFVCEKVYEMLHRESAGEVLQWQVTEKHYNCPKPVSPLTGKENMKNWWLEQWYQGQAEAKVLQKFLTNRVKITRQKFYNEVAKNLLRTQQ